MTKMDSEMPTYTSQVNKSIKPTTFIETTAHWRNAGNTPAIGVVTGIASVQQKEELTEEEFTLAYDKTSSRKFSATSSIGPGVVLDSSTIRQPVSFFDDDPVTPWFYWGWLVYRDIFPQSKIHVTEFCWKVNEIKWKISENGERVGRPHFSASACSHHNCVDEFCDDYATITAVSPEN